MNINALPEGEITITFLKPFLDLPVGEALNGMLHLSNEGVGWFESVNGHTTFFTMFAGEAPKKVDLSKIQIEENVEVDARGQKTYHLNVKGYPTFLSSHFSYEQWKDSEVFIGALVLSNPEVF